MQQLILAFYGTCKLIEVWMVDDCPDSFTIPVMAPSILSHLYIPPRQLIDYILVSRSFPISLRDHRLVFLFSLMVQPLNVIIFFTVSAALYRYCMYSSCVSITATFPPVLFFQGNTIFLFPIKANCWFLRRVLMLNRDAVYVFQSSITLSSTTFAKVIDRQKK